MPDEEAENLKRFVEGGGVLVLTCRSGVKTIHNTVVDMPLPGLLAELSGVEVSEYDSLTSDMHNSLAFTSDSDKLSGTPEVGVWCDVLEPKGAEVVARYTEEYYASEPAITLNRYGEGRVVYVGTVGDAAFYYALVPWLLELAAVTPLLKTPRGVEVSERRQGDTRLLFLLNHTEEPKEVALEGRYTDLFSSAAVEESVTLAPRDVLVLQEQA